MHCVLLNSELLEEPQGHRAPAEPNYAHIYALILD